MYRSTPKSPSPSQHYSPVLFFSPLAANILCDLQVRRNLALSALLCAFHQPAASPTYGDSPYAALRSPLLLSPSRRSPGCCHRHRVTVGAATSVVTLLLQSPPWGRSSALRAMGWGFGISVWGPRARPHTHKTRQKQGTRSHRV